MSGRDEPSPYAPPELSSFPASLRRERPMEDDRRLSWCWWLLPIVIGVAGFLLPTVERRGPDFIVIIDGRIAGLAASIAVVCGIGAINSFRQAGVAHRDGDFVLATWRYAMTFVAIGVGLVCAMNAVLMFLALISWFLT